MKLHNKLFLSCIALGTMASCTGDFDSMNTDPASLTDVSPAYVLPFIQETSVNIDATPYQRGDNLHSQFYCQYFTNTVAGWVTDRYGYNNDWSEAGFWNPYYTVLKHVKAIKESVDKHPAYTNIYQMMRITSAFATIGMTDLFGDIPYSEASEGVTTAKYDAQKDIYYAVFTELTDAVNILKQNLSGQDECTETNDLVYAGDIQKWIKFGNSLRLRYALRLAYIDPDKAKSEGEAALTSGVMESNADNAYQRVNAAGGWGHPLYMICNWNCFVMSKTMENILKHTSSVEDPRMPLWFGQTVGYVNNKKNPNPAFKGAQFQGVPNGITDSELSQQDADGYQKNDPNNNSCVYGLKAFPNWNSKDETITNTVVGLPFKIMNYAEVCQLKAEAALRGWSGAGDVETNFKNGIRASFDEERDGVDASLLDVTKDDEYINGISLSGSDEEKLEQIITQKWLALFPNGIEAWAECRRTGYPKLSNISQSEDPDINPKNGEFIKKLRYSDSERRDNKANATSASLNQGQGDGKNVRVWWDTKRYK